MDEVKGKMKGLMKKVNNSFSNSSSGTFKGQGRVLGSSSSSTSEPHSLSSSSSLLNPKPVPAKPSPPKVSDISQQKSQIRNSEKPVNSESREKSGNGFDPFDSLITSGKRNPNGYSLQVFECPVCGKAYTSEEEVSVHVESCLSTVDSENESGIKESDGVKNQVESCVISFLSGKPSDGSKEVVLRLLRNVVKQPENVKFRKLRVGNVKIKEAIGDAPGGIELLECVGFDLIEENGEMWYFMSNPSKERLQLLKIVISLLEPNRVEELIPVAVKKVEPLSSVAPAKIEEEPSEVKQVDRQVRVFFSVPEIVAAKIELPDSFYNLTAEELKRETDARKKKLEESKLLIPKSLKEKQAKSVKKRYKKTVIRVQFPDGVVLQAIFSPSESTGALYEFVSNALKDRSLEFDLQHPDLIKRRLIPRFPTSGEKAPTLEDEDLVPAALVKFKPIETDDVVFTGLCNELLEISEPLVSASAVPSS